MTSLRYRKEFSEIPSTPLNIKINDTYIARKEELGKTFQTISVQHYAKVLTKRNILNRFLKWK